MALNTLLQTAASITQVLATGKDLTIDELEALRVRAADSEERLRAAIAAAKERQGPGEG